MSKRKVSIAEEWLERIDQPWMSEPDPEKRPGVGIDKRAVRRMKDAAKDVLQVASPRYTDIYVFADGTGLWLKREDDWFPMDADDVERQRDN
jgi:hypothetical protein